jgi:RNA polymerase primary sigma factor
VLNRFGVRQNSNEGVAVELASRQEGVSSKELVKAIRQTDSPVFKRLEADGHHVTREGSGQTGRTWLRHRDDGPHAFKQHGENASHKVYQKLDNSEFNEKDYLGGATVSKTKPTNSLGSRVPKTSSEEDVVHYGSKRDLAEFPEPTSNTRFLLLGDVVKHYGGTPRLLQALESSVSSGNTPTIDWFLSPSGSIQLLNGPYFGANLILELEELVNRALEDNLDPSSIPSTATATVQSKPQASERLESKHFEEGFDASHHAPSDAAEPASPIVVIDETSRSLATYQQGEKVGGNTTVELVSSENDDLQDIPSFLRRDRPQIDRKMTTAGSSAHNEIVANDTGVRQSKLDSVPSILASEGRDQMREPLIEMGQTMEVGQAIDRDNNLRSMQISSIVEQFEISVRLRNVIMSAVGRNSLPVVTIGGYLDLGREAYERFLNLPNCGKKSADELDSIIRKLCELYGPSTDDGLENDEYSQLLNLRLVDLAHRYEISNRLKNAILTADEKRYLPYLTVGEYLDAGADGRSLLSGLPKFGRTTVNEFELLIHSFVSKSDDRNGGASVGTDYGRLDENTRSKILALFSDLPFPEVVRSWGVSVRLNNAFAQAKSLPSNLEDYFQNCIRIDTELKRMPNVGKNSVLELRKVSKSIFLAGLQAIGVSHEDVNQVEGSVFGTSSLGLSVAKLVLDNIESRMEDGKSQLGLEEIIEIRNFGTTEHGVISEIAVVEYLKEELDQRWFEILNHRYGLTGETCLTLAEVGQIYSLTRERIRQIELKAIKALRHPSRRSVSLSYLDANASSLTSALAGDNKFVSAEWADEWVKDLPGVPRLCMDVLYKGVEGWACELFSTHTENRSTVGWFVTVVSELERKHMVDELKASTADTSSLRQRIQNVICVGTWPIDLEHLRKAMPDITEPQLVTCLENDLDASISNGVVESIGRLPTSTRLILVLRHAGRGLPLDEIRSYHKELFGVDIAEHAVGGTLGRLDEALIVDRGVYNIYENLALSTIDLQNIRDRCASYIEQANHFVSSKVLHAELREKLSMEGAHELNAYSVYGICQDDQRFACRRGLMLGLSQKNFLHKFTPLAETVFEIVDAHGPMSVPEIQEHIAHERNVLDVSITGALDQSRNYVRSDRGRYDHVSRVIGTEAQVQRLEHAIQIGLGDAGCSFPILFGRLLSVGFNYPETTVQSFLRSYPSINYSDGIFSNEYVDELVDSYNRVLSTIFDINSSSSTNRESVVKQIKDDRYLEMVDIDYRFCMSQSGWNNKDNENSEEPAFLDDLLEEFDF